MRKLAVHTVAVVCLLGLTCPLGHASVTEVQYTFFAQIGGNDSASAQFLSPTFIATDTAIPASQLESCQFIGLPCASVTLKPDFFVTNLGFLDVFQLRSVNGIGVGDGFPNGAFGAYGTYFDLTGTALLSVQSFTFIPTPEPSTLSLMGSGVMGLVGFLRRRN